MNVMRTVSVSAVFLGLMMSATAAVALSPAEEGRRIFLRENCYGCHGGRAGGGMGPNLRDEADDVGEAVREGRDNGMPAYPRLTDADINNLKAYFRSIRTRGEPTFTHWWESVPTR